MPRLKDVTQEEVRDIIDSAQDLQARAHDIERRLTSVTRSEVDSPLQAASALLAASRTIADLASAFLLRAALQEQQREIEKQYSAIRDSKL